MQQKTAYNIGIVLLCLAVLVMIFLVGRSAFIAGGRTACKNTNEDHTLVEGFKCEEIRTTRNIWEVPEYNLSVGNEPI